MSENCLLPIYTNFLIKFPIVSCTVTNFQNFSQDIIISGNVTMHAKNSLLKDIFFLIMHNISFILPIHKAFFRDINLTDNLSPSFGWWQTCAHIHIHTHFAHILHFCFLFEDHWKMCGVWISFNSLYTVLYFLLWYIHCKKSTNTLVYLYCNH